MSKTITLFFAQNPLLEKYAQMELVNIMSLASYIENSSLEADRKTTTSSIAMQIRRYIKSLPSKNLSLNSSINTSCKLISRSGISELIYNKTEKNRAYSQHIFQKLIKRNQFVSLVEGEKEIVIITDFPYDKLTGLAETRKYMCKRTQDLGYISIDLPMKLREVVGVYNTITSIFTTHQIPIHSFHTIGGEVVILVKNRDLIKTQKALNEMVGR